MHGLQPCGALVACGQRLFLQAISPPFLVVSSSTKKHDVGRVFLMCAKFLAHICTISLKLCVEPVGCARRLRILCALIAFSCRQQLYGLFCHRCLSAAVLFVLVFQLEDIVDFPLIHRPYGFIVQFLMINTGNGGSFVQL